MKMADAKQKRNEQLKRWIGSETDLEPPVVKRQKTKVKFDDGAVFLAACSSGDTDEVLKLLHRGADINYANVDGLTALHQVCAPRLPFSDPAGPRSPAGAGPPLLRSGPPEARAGCPLRTERDGGRKGGRERGREGARGRAAGGRRAGGPFSPVGGGVGAGRFPGPRGKGTCGRTGAWALGSRPGGVGVAWLCPGPDVRDLLGRTGDAGGKDPPGAFGTRGQSAGFGSQGASDVL